MKRMMANPEKANKVNVAADKKKEKDIDKAEALATSSNPKVFKGGGLEVAGDDEFSYPDNRRKIPFYKSNKRRNKEVHR
jgi:hypothetical protein